jgi:hypothetical protein
VEKEVIALEDTAYRRQLAVHLQKMAEDTFGFRRNYATFVGQLL